MLHVLPALPGCTYTILATVKLFLLAVHLLILLKQTCIDLPHDDISTHRTNILQAYTLLLRIMLILSYCTHFLDEDIAVVPAS